MFRRINKDKSTRAVQYEFKKKNRILKGPNIYSTNHKISNIVMGGKSEQMCLTIIDKPQKKQLCLKINMSTSVIQIKLKKRKCGKRVKIWTYNKVSACL